MDIALIEDQVVEEIWLAYKKTRDYKKGLIHAVPPHNIIVEKQERLGLRAIYLSLIIKLKSEINSILELKSRTVGIWLEEWKKMHKLLFQHILKECGGWRKNEVRFGIPGDEDLYHIPLPRQVPSEMNILAKTITDLLKKDYQTPQEKFDVLAYIHYQFIRIHPFSDGNGRIARAITDQLSVFFGFPPAMAGYPRHDIKRRENYHKAIKACIEDPSCHQLSLWIGGYIEEQLKLLA